MGLSELRFFFFKWGRKIIHRL